MNWVQYWVNLARDSNRKALGLERGSYNRRNEREIVKRCMGNARGWKREYVSGNSYDASHKYR